MKEISAAARAELAPAGKLRVGINFGNHLLTKRDAATGAQGGIAVDLARELAKRIGVPIEIVPHESAGSLADSARSGTWEVGFLGAEPQRAQEIDFTAAYLEIEATYLVAPGSTIQKIEDVDRKGVRIAVASKSAYDLYLMRTIKNAELVHGKSKATIDMFINDKLDVLASLKPGLDKVRDKYPGSRILDGRFTAVLQACGTPKGHPEGAKFLKEYIEDVKASGLVAQVIKSNGIQGVTVAPPASA